MLKEIEGGFIYSCGGNFLFALHPLLVYQTAQKLSVGDAGTADCWLPVRISSFDLLFVFHSSLAAHFHLAC
jgi:hypothetical protein